MATYGTVNEILTLNDPDLDEFRITYSKYLGRFECPWEKWKTPSTFGLLGWKFLEKDNSNIPEKEKLEQVLPILDIQKEKLMSPPEDNIQVTWIGHATLLVQFDGITILTDPVFRDYCGPKVPGIPLGFKRYRKAACQVKDFQHIDAVIVSNDHFDHLDWQSAGEISKMFPNVKWFVGKNSRDLCQMKREENITDLFWWQEKTIEINGHRFTFACTPAQHWCRRSVFDMNKRLWCSWVVTGPTKSFFFAGDTGYYEPVFKKIGEKYGPFSLSALPIGCIEPRPILKYQHVSPEEAVKIHYDVNSKMSISIHWGAYHMTNEFYLDPPHLLEECMWGDKDIFISLQHGETWVVGSPRERPGFMDVKPFSKKNGPNIVEDGGSESSKKAMEGVKCEKEMDCEDSDKANASKNIKKAKESENSDKGKERENSEKAKESENREIANESEESEKGNERENSEKAKESGKGKEIENSEIKKEIDNSEKAKERENSEKAKEGENSEKAKEIENNENAKETENSEKAKENENSEKAKEKENSEKAKESEYNKKTKESYDREKAKESENREKAKESEHNEKGEEREQREKAKESENIEKAKESENSEKAKERENSEIAKERGNSKNAKESENSEKAKESENSEIAKERGNSKNAKETEYCKKAKKNEDREKATERENSEKANESENSEKAKESENIEQAKERENSEKAKESENSQKARERDNSGNAKEIESDEKAKERENREKRNKSENSEKAKECENSEKAKEIEN